MAVGLEEMNSHFLEVVKRSAWQDEPSPDTGSSTFDFLVTAYRTQYSIGRKGQFDAIVGQLSEFLSALQEFFFSYRKFQPEVSQ